MFDLDVLFQKGELIPVIIQDEETREVLMLGFTNRKAVELPFRPAPRGSGAGAARPSGTRGRAQDISSTSAGC